jgi:hypothetical protein
MWHSLCPHMQTKSFQQVRPQPGVTGGMMLLALGL